jgi:hypothetical protein
VRILSLHAENIKKLKVVDITAGPDAMVLTGRNEQGKTSALDAIEYVLAGGKALKYTLEPIRRGEERATAYVHLGEPQYDSNGSEVSCEPNLKITRKWTSNERSYLTVENADGSVRKAGQGILDSIVGNLTFDPLAFSLLKEKEQLETLLALVRLPIDLNEWRRERQFVYDERTSINRTVQEIEAQIAGIGYPSDTPDVETSATQVLAEQNEAQAVIDTNRVKRTALVTLCNNIANNLRDQERCKAEIEKLKNTLITLREDLDGLSVRIDEQEAERDYLSKECEALIDPDLTIFQDRIAQVEALNVYVRAKRESEALMARLGTQRQKSREATKQLSALDKQREDALASAEMPVEGLSFDDNGVTFKGIPFRQCSSEERLRVSVAVGMALNPKLRVMFIRDASLLDNANRDVMCQMAKDNQYQIWMEVVGGKDSPGIVFEEGEVIADNRPEK